MQRVLRLRPRLASLSLLHRASPPSLRLPQCSTQLRHRSTASEDDVHRSASTSEDDTWVNGAPQALVDLDPAGGCRPECNSSACFHDNGRCAAGRGKAACPAQCRPRWRGDGKCDPVCFRSECEWDGGDCSDSAEGCAAGCLDKMIDDGICDEACTRTAVLPLCSHVW